MKEKIKRKRIICFVLKYLAAVIAHQRLCQSKLLHTLTQNLQNNISLLFFDKVHV